MSFWGIFFKALGGSAGALAGIIILLLFLSFVLNQQITYENGVFNLRIGPAKECPQLSCPEYVGFSVVNSLPKSYSEAVRITNLRPDRDTYFLDENGTVRFSVDNPLKLAYSLESKWLQNGSIYGAHQFSGEYNGTDNDWSVFNNLTKVGDWSVYIIVSWKHEDNSYSSGNITHLKVLS